MALGQMLARRIELVEAIAKLQLLRKEVEELESALRLYADRCELAGHHTTAKAVRLCLEEG